MAIAMFALLLVAIGRISSALQRLLTAWLALVHRFDIQQSPMPALTPARQWAAVSIVSSLFFIWGFAYGLLDTMNFHVKVIMHLDANRGLVALLATGYYTPYLVCPLLMSGPMIKHWGYRWTFLAGLLFFTLGNFAMAGAVSTKSLPGMVASMLIVGMGVSTLERAANPYAAKVGPPGTAELRLVFAQGAAAIGTIVAPLVAAQVVPSSRPGSGPHAKVEVLSLNGVAYNATALSLPGVSGTALNATRTGSLHESDDTWKLGPIVQLYQAVGYGVIGLIFVFLIVFFRTRIVPEVDLGKHIPSHQLHFTESKLQRFVHHSIWSNKRLWCAWFANFMNVSNQVIVAQFFIEYGVQNSFLDEKKAQHFLSVAQTCFAVGRYVFVLLLLRIKPRYAIVFFVALAVGAVALATSVTGMAGIAMLCLAMFAEGPTFPTIFATGIRNLGEYENLGESILIMSICGGGFGPAIFGQIADKFGDRVGKPVVGTVRKEDIKNVVSIDINPTTDTVTSMVLDGAKGLKVAFWLPAACFLVPVFIYTLGLNSIWRREFDMDWYEEKKAKAQRKAEKAAKRAAAKGSPTSGQDKPSETQVEDLELARMEPMHSRSDRSVAGVQW